MRLLHSSLSRAAITLAALTASLATTSATFVSTCVDINLYNVSLISATCANGLSGQGYTSSIDLSLCIANYDGNLACAYNGGYAGSCSGCSITSNYTFVCQCPNAGKVNPSNVTLDDCINNVSGTLTCAA